MKKASSLFSILLLLAQWIFAQENFYSRIDSFKSSDFDNKKPMTIVMTTHKKLRHYRDEITPILLAKKVTLVSAQFTETNERTTINSTIETKRMKSKTVAETTQP